MASQADFETIFSQLKDILQVYASQLALTADGPAGYSLNGPYSPKYKKDLFFGAVQINKNYVSYHLMPVYMYPDLLQGISDRLRKRMQGKSCFNFKQSDAELFAELAALTRAGYERFHQEAG